MSPDEARVRDWLHKRGYKTEYEPAIVSKGKKPDFVALSNAVTPSVLWAEVKSIGPSKSILALNKTWPILKEMGLPKNVNGHAMLHATENVREQSVRALLKMFHGKAIKYANENVHLIFIQQESDKDDIRYIEVQGKIPRLVWVRGSGGKKVAVPADAIEDPRAIASFESAGQYKSIPAFMVFDWQTPFDCAVIARINPKDRPLTAISSMSGGSSNLKSRALNAIEDANGQLRNACIFNEAPGVVFLVPSEAHADDEMIAMAAYGDLTVSINGKTNQLGESFYGLNGAFRPDKNRHISTLIRLRQEGPATYFPNPHARYPINESASLFAGIERAKVRL